MSDVKHRVSLQSPTVEEYCLLREKTTWGKVDSAQVLVSLNNSLFHVVIHENEKIIGMARVVGDGALYFYIQDVVVDPEYQNRGLGTILMHEVENYLSSSAKKGSTIGLLSAKGKEKFYFRFGYKNRPSENLGNGMCKFV